MAYLLTQSMLMHVNQPTHLWQLIRLSQISDTNLRKMNIFKRSPATFWKGFFPNLKISFLLENCSFFLTGSPCK